VKQSSPSPKRDCLLLGEDDQFRTDVPSKEKQTKKLGEKGGGLTAEGGGGKDGWVEIRKKIEARGSGGKEKGKKEFLVECAS